MKNDERYIVAMEAYEAGNHKLALTKLEEIIEAGMRFPDILNKAAYIYASMGNLNQAAAFLKEALAANPKYTEAAINYVHILAEMGDYDEALKVQQTIKNNVIALENDKSIDPFVLGKIANLHAQVGEAYASVAMFAEAIEEFRRAVRLRPAFVDLRTRLAILLRDNGEVDSAITELQSIVKEAPDYLPAYTHIGLAYHCLGDFNMAKSHWQKVLDKEPDNRTVNAYMSMLAIKQISKADQI